MTFSTARGAPRTPGPREGGPRPSRGQTTPGPPEHGSQLVEAARELAETTGSAAFTVAQVAARAGTSLKAFYRTFAGKDDLLVALLAAESRVGADVLRAMIVTAPGDRLDAYVTGIFELAALPGSRGYARVLVQEHRRLAERRPEDLDAALAPLVRLLEDIVGDRRDARAVFGLVLSGIHDVSLGRADASETAAYLATFSGRALRRSTVA
jgi:AcrR family transcriptional regulator